MMGKNNIEVESNNGMEEKKLIAYLIVNLNNKNMRIVKKKIVSSRLGVFDMQVKLDMTFFIPEHKEIIAKGEFEIPESKVRGMLLESL